MLTEYEIPDRLFSRIFAKVNDSVEVITVSADEFRRIRGTEYKDPRVCSSYDLDSGRIFLVDEKWCYSQLIHEVLHSTYTFSRKEISGSNLRFLFEGLTEFIVGFVLKNKLIDCYRDWRIVSPKNPCFSSMYLEFVKPWHYLYGKIDFQEVIKVYFDVQLDNPLKTIDDVLSRLIGAKYDISFAENVQKEVALLQF